MYTNTHKVVSASHVVARSVGAAAALSADFAPVPFMGPAVALVLGILKLCDNVRSNKHEIQDLGARCESLLYALRDTGTQLAPEPLQELLEHSTELLEEIKRRMTAWIAAKTVKQFFLQSDIAEDIKRCHQAIDTFLSNFNIKSQMEIHNWMARFDINRQKDHDEVMNYLGDNRNQNELMHQTMASNFAEIMGIMSKMQESMGSYPVGDFHHNGLSDNLWGMQRASGQLLPKLELKHGEVRKKHNYPATGSAQFDIYEGEYLRNAKCAIKVLRGVELTKKIKDRFLREVEIWRKVWELDKGEYFLPFWGTCFDEGPYPYMVSPWMDNGDVLKYVTRFPDVNRKHLIKRIAEGLRVLHTYTPPIAHGDLKAANILVDDKGNPIIADFGLSKMMADLTEQPFTQSRGVSESYRWFAPELCSPPGMLSCASDIFAYAMTVIEIMTSQQPFAHIKRTPEVLIRSTMGERPLRPTGPDADVIVQRGLDDGLWQLLTECWSQEPAKRPDIHQVLARLPAP